MGGAAPRRARSGVTVMNALMEDGGGNNENLRGADGVSVVVADIANTSVTRPLVERAEIIFNLSGKVSHIDSVKDPLADHHANSTSQLVLLETCRRYNGKVRVVLTSTRQIYGRADSDRVTEQSPLRPIDPNGIS